MTEFDYNKVLDFWFEEIDPKMWFAKDESFDSEIKTRFYDHYQAASQGELYYWRDNIHGRLAEIILLDQFPRNMFREDSRSFATDLMALILSQEALRLASVKDLNQEEKRFLIMPWMHSESKRIHQEAVDLFSKFALNKALKYEYKHKEIIDQFGRYPHRNQVLNRQSTPEEQAFLQEFEGF